MGSYVPNTPEERQEMLRAMCPRPCIWTGRSICRPA